VRLVGPVLVFVVVWLLIAFRGLRWLPIGRTGGALAGAVGMVAVGALTPEAAWAAVDGGTISLLLGMMLITAYLERAGWFGWSAHHLVARAGTPIRLLLAVSWSAAVLSAVLVNDTVCLFLTPLVLRVVRGGKLPPGPYLIALATSANLGSAATLVGNPQNMLIGSMSHLPFGAFLRVVGPAALGGMLVHTAILLASYRDLAELPALATAERPPPLARDAPLVAGVFGAVLVGFLAGVNLGYGALAGAVALMILDRREPRDALAAVDWELLLFFAGLFVVVKGLGSTGLPDAAWARVAPAMSLTSAPGLAVMTAALAIGSNVVSNVPLVLLVGDHLAALGHPERSWPLLGLVTTVAGNLTLVGSVANLIVAEQAKDDHELGFFEYLRVGLPSTIAVLAVGVAVVAWGTP
jgi:Na+/H+ antiporter NhaD/arsenite permease-like protein